MTLANRRAMCAFALVLLMAPPLSASTVTDKLDATLSTLVARTGTPGAAATIVQDGTVLWSGATGFADPAAGVPFTTNTLSSIASVTKLFVSTIVTKLDEEKRLSLDESIAPYVPSTIPGADKVTIRHLVDMTAGYADVEALPEFQAAFKDPNYPWTRAELFAPIAAPQFVPGSQYEYSNTNYLLLGQVIDSIYPGGTDAAFRDFIAGPALLGDGAFFARNPDVAARVAHGFSTQNGTTLDVSAGADELVNTGVWGTIWADGGIVATADAVARFGEALYTGKLLNPENTAATFICGYTFSNRCWDGFVGAFNGYSAFVLHDARRSVTIATVLNGLDEDTFSQSAFLDGLVDAYDTQVAPSPVPVPASLPLLAVGVAALFGLRRRRKSGGRI